MSKAQTRYIKLIIPGSNSFKMEELSEMPALVSNTPDYVLVTTTSYYRTYQMDEGREERDISVIQPGGERNLNLTREGPGQ